MLYETYLIQASQKLNLVIHQIEKVIKVFTNEDT